MDKKNQEFDLNEKILAGLEQDIKELRDANTRLVDLYMESKRPKREKKMLEALDATKGVLEMAAKWIMTDERAMKRGLSDSDA